MKPVTTVIVLMLPFSLLAGVGGGYLSILTYQPSKEALIREFYDTENAVHVSPHSIRKKIAEGAQDFILVDLRSQEEYEKEHIVGAVSIPAYKDRDTSDYGAVDRIVAAFREFPKDKNIIVYCYSMPCMTGRKIGQMLTEHGIYVQHLGIGWNEWRHFWTLWNHEHEWSRTNVEEYVASGKEPGSFKGTPSTTPCTEGQFGC
ncbi:rhodanese-like domain-containing protein [Candidatus Peregrinibacteria bacterium]|nr:rhodanese-like domain-containing protein [Candidatus Peregrinibacteria bacterium]